MSLAEFRKKLRETPVSTLFPQKREAIVSVNSNSLISDVFQSLAEHGILSVPVLDKSLSKPRFTAFVDIIDIVAWVLAKVPEDQVHQDGALPAAFHSHYASEIVGMSQRNPFYPIEESAPLEEAINLLAKKRVHRIPVLDSDGHMVTLITQSHVIHYLYENLSYMDDFKMKTVADLKLGLKEVSCIDENEKAIKAFKTIAEKKISAVGVVNSQGQLIGNISASDFKSLGYKHQVLKKLYLTSKDFILRVKEAHHTKTKIISIPTYATFAEVVKTLADNRIHRVYITDNFGKPVGIISLTDILDLLLGSK